MKRNIQKNYNNGFCTLGSAVVVRYGADIHRCSLLLWYDVNYNPFYGHIVEGPKEYTGTLFVMVILWPGLIFDSFQRVLFPLEN